MSLSSPVLNEGELESLLTDASLKPQILPTFFDIRKGVDGSLEKTLSKLCEAADEAVRNGSQLLILSDRSDELVSTFWSVIIYFNLSVKYTLSNTLSLIRNQLGLQFQYFWQWVLFISI